MMGSFQRPVGSDADLKELEYISALHQTQLPNIRSNATISATDVSLYLCSRYGLKISHRDAIQIVRGLGGNVVDTEEKTVPEEPLPVEQSEKFVASSETRFKSMLKRKGKERFTSKTRALSPFWEKHLKKELKQQHIQDRKEDMASVSVDSDDMVVYKEDYLDLVQLTSIMLIPSIVCSSQELLNRTEESFRVICPPTITNKEIEIGDDEKKEDSRTQEENLYDEEKQQSGPTPSSAESLSNKDGCTVCKNNIDFFSKNTTNSFRKKRQIKQDDRKALELEFMKELKPRPHKLISEVYQFLMIMLEEHNTNQKEQEHITKNTEGESFHKQGAILDDYLVRKLLHIHGEVELAADDDLVRSMVDCARGNNDDAKCVLFDENAFARALTSDMKSWEVGCEERLSTHFFDVFGFDTEEEKEKVMKAEENEGVNPDAASPIDITVSKPQIIENGTRNLAGKSSIDDITGIKQDEAGVDPSPSSTRNDLNKGGSISASVCHSDSIRNINTDLEIEKNLIDTDSKNISFVDGTDKLNGKDGEKDTLFLSTDVTENETTVGNVAMGSCKENSDHLAINMDKAKATKWAFNRVKCLSFIDSAVDTQWSRTYHVAAWLFYITTTVSYGWVLASLVPRTSKCGKSFGCTLGETLFTWLVTALLLCFVGIVMLVPISVGNSAYYRSWKTTLFSMVVTAAYAIVPYCSMMSYIAGFPHAEDGKLTELEEQILLFAPALHLTVAVGSVILLAQVFHLLLQTISPEVAPRLINLKWWLTTNNVNASYNIKLAATIKINKMLENAHRLHYTTVHDNCTGKPAVGDEAVFNFHVWGEEMESCGGFRWTWRKIWDKSLFRKEGLWINNRFIVGQTSHVIIGSLVGYFLVWGTTNSARAAQKARDDVDASSIQYPQYVYDMIPEAWMIKRSGYPAAAISIIAMVVLILVYLPSTVSMAMKLRSGVMPFLHDPYSLKYRKAADQTFYNLGNMIFALFGSGGMFFLIFFVIIFLTIWPITQPAAALIWAWSIGLAITVILKVIVMKCFNEKFYRAFYRKRPGAANFSGLVLECWQIGVAGGVLLGRLTQFLLATAFWIGRVDVQFLTEDVRLGGWRFDTAPTHFKKDILVHEAHRHPYIDRLGAMYMMKLKYEDDFSSRAGACWRILFVMALMPWMAKYRVSREDLSLQLQEAQLLFDDEDDCSLKRDKSRGLVGRIAETVKDEVALAANDFIDEWPARNEEKSKAD